MIVEEVKLNAFPPIDRNKNQICARNVKTSFCIPSQNLYEVCVMRVKHSGSKDLEISRENNLD